MTSDSTDVLFDVTDNVAVVTLNAPHRRNALTPDMASRFGRICATVNDDQTIGALVLTGHGPTFCAGADLSLAGDLGKDPAGAVQYALSSSIYGVPTALRNVAVPTIVAARGIAVGAGFNLFLSADLRLVSEHLRLRSAFCTLGVHPGGGHFALLGHSAGREVASALGLFGEEITSGIQAVELGLAWRVAPDDELEAQALALAARIACDPALARRSVRSLRAELGPPPMSLDLAVDFERGSQMWSVRRQYDETGRPLGR